MRIVDIITEQTIDEVGDSAYDVHHAETRRTKLKGTKRNYKLDMTDIRSRDFFDFSTPEGISYRIGLHQYESHGKNGRGVIVDFQNLNEPEGPYDISGTGNEFGVFSTVRKVVLKFLSEHPNLNFVTFASKNTQPSRVRLYTAAAKNPAKWFPGFTDVSSKSNGDLTQFTFAKQTAQAKTNEEINQDIRNPEFEHEQQIGEYLYTAKTKISDSGIYTYLLIRCYDGDKLIGKVNFEVRVLAGKKWLESQQTEVAPEYKKQGVASAMYAYAKMLGNDIKPSPYQSDEGKGMWAGWKKSGAAKHLGN